MELMRLYGRAIGLLAPEKRLAILLALSSVLLAAIQLAEPIFFGRVVDALSQGKDALPLIALWAGLGIFGIVASVAVSIYADRLAHRRRLAVMTEAFEQAMTLPLSYHATRGSGALVSNIARGTESLFWLWLKALREQLVALVGIILLVPTAIGVDPRMAVILALLSIAYVALSSLTMAKTASGQNELEQLRYDVSSRVGDVVSNVTVVQSFARFAAESAAMRELSMKLLNAQYPVLNWWGLLAIMQRAAATITMVAVFAVGAMLAARGELTVGEIVSFVAFASLLISKLDVMSSFFTTLHQGAPSLRMFFNLLDEQPAIAERPDAKPLVISDAEVRYDKVSFTYPGSEQGIHAAEFTVRPGETLAIVGPTGSGKSTLVSLLQRLRAPDAGQIRIDGQDIAGVTLSSLRNAISIVFQDAGLFNRSIAENIRIGRPEATDAEVERAARLAEAHDFIMAKPGGYGFIIGERGASLSGGERQRLAIARAILKDAPILVLDEATSALDAATEAKIKRALDALRKGRTTLVIAHRLSTVADANEIIVVDRGHIRERGTFRALVAAKGLFAHMVQEGGFTIPAEPERERELLSA